jgi:hypothetical protein
MLGPSTVAVSIAARWDIFPVIVPNQLETKLVTTVGRKVIFLVIAPIHEKPEIWKHM